MEIYIKLSFWLGVFGSVVRILALAKLSYPRTREETIGYATAQTIVTIVFTAWAGYLLYA